jgi:hypothetical protein
VLNANEQQEQTWLRAPEDYQEGVKAASERSAVNCMGLREILATQVHYVSACVSE